MTLEASLPVDIAVVEGDLASRFSDLLVLKFADGFFGADQFIAKKLGFSEHLRAGAKRILDGRSIESKKVLFCGVGVLTDFRYGEIRSFARKALGIAQLDAPETRKITTPIHGPGYGLDERESLLALVAGFVDAVKSAEMPRGLRSIEIVEKDAARAKRMQTYLDEVFQRVASGSQAGKVNGQPLNSRRLEDNLTSFGELSEKKVKLFVAMPFKASFTDEFKIAIQEACDKNEIICERIDKQAYVGDVLQSIKVRISSYDGMIALLNEGNPNVFLEIGFAWAKEKPTVLLLREGSDLPFDTRGQKCIMYDSISALREMLTQELRGLKDAGVFRSSR